MQLIYRRNIVSSIIFMVFIKFIYYRDPWMILFWINICLTICDYKSYRGIYVYICVYEWCTIYFQQIPNFDKSHLLPNITMTISHVKIYLVCLIIYNILYDKLSLRRLPHCPVIGMGSEIYKITKPLNTLRPRQNGRHFADDIFKRIFLNESVSISIKISLKFVSKSQFIIFLNCQATSHYLNQWWLIYWRIYASLGLNDLFFYDYEFITRSTVTPFDISCYSPGNFGWRKYASFHSIQRMTTQSKNID